MHAFEFIASSWVKFALLIHTTLGPSASCSAAPRPPGLAECASPINVVPSTALPSTISVRTSYGRWHVSDVQPRRIGRVNLSFISDAGGGVAQVGTGYDDFDLYVLRSIELKAPSEHTFMGRRLPAEVQLWHEPSITNDLSVLQKRRKDAHTELKQFVQEINEWGAVVGGLRNSSSKEALFPSLETEKDWVTMVRDEADVSGRKVLSRALHVRSVIKDIDRSIASLIRNVKRPSSARAMAISLLLLSSEVETPQQAQANNFVKWLLSAARSPVNQSEGGPSSQHKELDFFEFGDIPSQSIKDVAGAGSLSALGYSGGLAQLPCSPIARRFVMSEPISVGPSAVAELVNASGTLNLSKITGKNSGIWWDGERTNFPPSTPVLRTGTISVVELSTELFKKPPSLLSSDSFTILSWKYINFFCVAFLISALVMLFTTCGLWTRQCFDP